MVEILLCCVALSCCSSMCWMEHMVEIIVLSGAVVLLVNVLDGAYG